MNDYRAYVYNDYNSIYHTGILGMKWGKRRYQNSDGTLTEEGKKRYAKMKKKWTTDTDEFEKHYDDLSESEKEYAKKRMRDLAEIRSNEEKARTKRKPSKLSKIAKVGAAAYGVGKFVTDPKVHERIRYAKNKLKHVYNEYKKRRALSSWRR